MSARLPRETEADRLRRCRLIFARAIADNCSMQVAAHRLWREAQAERERTARARCEQALRRRDIEAGSTAVPFIPTDDSDEGLAWYQR